MSRISIEQDGDQVFITIDNDSEQVAVAAFDALTRQLGQGRIAIEVLPDPARVAIADSDGDEGA